MRIPGGLENNFDAEDDGAAVGSDNGPDLGHDPKENFDGESLSVNPDISSSRAGEKTGVESLNEPAKSARQLLEEARKAAAEFEKNKQGLLAVRKKALEEKGVVGQQFSKEAACRSLDNEIATISKRQAEAKFPVKDGRIDMFAYKNVSGYEGMVDRSLRELELARRNRETSVTENSDGSLFEKMMYVLFNEYFPGCDFVQASESDDESVNKSRIDAMLFIEGEVVCTFDFTLTHDEYKLEEKSKKAYLQNGNGGVGIQYCFAEANGKIDLREEVGVPLINITGDDEQFSAALNELNLEMHGKTIGPDSKKARKILMYRTIEIIYRWISALLPSKEVQDAKLGRIFDNGQVYVKRLEKLKTLLETNYPREEVDGYLLEQVKKPKRSRLKPA
jgi:hypothetical protein